MVAKSARPEDFRSYRNSVHDSAQGLVDQLANAEAHGLQPDAKLCLDTQLTLLAGLGGGGLAPPIRACALSDMSVLRCEDDTPVCLHRGCNLRNCHGNYALVCGCQTIICCIMLCCAPTSSIENLLITMLF